MSAGMIAFDIAAVVGTNIDADGFDEIQHDAEGEQKAGAPSNQAHHFFGSWGRALDPVTEPAKEGAVGQPDPSKTSQVLVGYEGSSGHSWAMEDPRLINVLPTPGKGEHLTYSFSGCFTRHHIDGSISHATTDAGGFGGQTVAQRITPTSFMRFAPWGRETFDATGYRLTHAGGARFSMGFLSGLPAPLDGGISYARVQADTIELNGAAIHIGPTASIVQPVAQAAPLVVVLNAIGVAMTALAAVTSTLVPASGATVGQTGAAAAAVTAAGVLIAQALLTISTQTAIG